MSIIIWANSGFKSFAFFPSGVLGHLQPCLDNWSTKYCLPAFLQCVLVLFISFSVSCFGFGFGFGLAFAFGLFVEYFFNRWSLISWFRFWLSIWVWLSIWRSTWFSSIFMSRFRGILTSRCRCFSGGWW